MKTPLPRVLLGAFIGLVAPLSFAFAAPPTCSFYASPSSVAYGGDTTLYWNTNDASVISIDNGIGVTMPSGSYALTGVTYNRTYTMTVTGPGGTATCQAVVTVGSSSQIPSCSIYGSPSSVYYGGTSSLVFSSSNATTAYIQDIGSVSPTGSYSLGSLYTSKTYLMTVTGPGGTNTCSTTVTVLNQNYYSQPTCTLDASTTYTSAGQGVTLSWYTNGAYSVSISNVGATGVSGTQTVYPYVSTTYVLTAIGNGGTATCSRTVTVNNSGSYQGGYAPTCSLSANPPVVYDGSSTTLSWTTANAYSVSIDNGVGAVQPAGTYVVNVPAGARTYTLTAYGNGGVQTCRTTVQTQNAYSNTGGPTCGIVVQSDVYGGLTLAWYSENSILASISGIGPVERTGTTVVAPGQVTTYTLTVRGYDGQERSCQATAYPTQQYAGFGGGTGGVGVKTGGGVVMLRRVPYTGATDYIFPLFLSAFAITALYGATKMRRVTV